MPLSGEQITNYLADESLVLDAPDFKGEIQHLAYNSQDVEPNTLFFIKGNFKPEYLEDAKTKGVVAVVAPVGFNETLGLPTWVVDDVAAAMSIVSMAFYDFPQNKLALIGITGTKGKTSTAYMAHEILNQATDGKAALSSTLAVITGQDPQYHYRAHLTTPESLDLFRWMHEAVENGMTHMVMEVSSQAYKKERVYGLRYDVGVFLNISEDHIGPNEHPTFEDYIECKMELFDHSDQIVLNADSGHFPELIERAELAVPKDGLWLYAKEHADEDDDMGADISYRTMSEDLQGSQFALTHHGAQAAELELDGEYALDMPGDFNQGNATAAMMATRLVGADATSMVKGLQEVKVPGRMQELTSQKHGTIYVDYAHNYASIAALLQFVRANERVDKLRIVVGAPGNKGVSRRPGIGEAINEGADIAYLTSDDPQYENPADIVAEIKAHVDTDKVQVIEELDRTQAITDAITHSGPDDVVVLAGKGLDEYQKIDGIDTPYENDWAIANRVVNELEAE
ncbi:UDP-N-acetylmuramoyl-L-alanyl-D-glutamate--2,6-diaminopimelate ligase [Weissella uvarum]|uniref:UDP-N-acetylmuramyl-tripeptide synthetase n=1 Tax=Weissella uvarum TaxID=1479233 RepID=UPI00195FC22E|nr:UDP-N-acetylmuramyl-tripeptide synthetase [Weissella uvarum]MBM7617144.1 UDP-N-acetylmuramoyl-L-alanyl-D-glutamate--2,6-diaminopimelate ligase [Weissella uvarum]MCM0595440.1 UDP-N-acetylmuramyl-tripeptide synthetase [Weissella uvarum]